jgi:hypothetical protein
VSCKCGEISIDGGDVYFKCRATNWSNFLRLDDAGNEISMADDEPTQLPIPTKQEKLQVLDEMIKSYQNLPPQALYAAVSHADFRDLLLCLSSILRED